MADDVSHLLLNVSVGTESNECTRLIELPRQALDSDLDDSANTVGSYDLEEPACENNNAIYENLLRRHRQLRWELNWKEAAIYLQEGKNNDKFVSHPKSRAELPAYLLTHRPWFYCVDLVTSVILLSLVVFERPAVIKVPIAVHATIEMLCLIIIACELLMKLKWLGWRTYICHQRTTLKSACLVVMFAEALTVLIRQTSHFRVTRAIRPLFFVDSYYLKGARRFTRQALQSLPAVMDMLLLLLFIMLMFSLLGYYLFSSVPGDQYFQTLLQSFLSLFVLLTTANFPDVMMPVFSYSRWSAAFFIVYITLELYLFMNLFLAVVYNTFSTVEKQKVKNLLLHKRRACQHAFRLLVSRQKPDGITLRHFQGLMKQYKASLSDRDVYLCFKALNQSATGEIKRDEFYRIYTCSTLVWKRRQPSALWITECRPVCYTIVKGLNYVVQTNVFRICTNVVIGLHFLWLLVDTAVLTKESEISPSEREARMYEYLMISILFVTLYVLELCVKVLGLGPRQFVSHGWNLFDTVVVTVACVGLVTFSFFPHTKALLILRPLRLVKLFRFKRRYRDVLGTVMIFAPQIVSISFVLSMMYYAFSILGMELFSHKDMRNCCINSSVESYYVYNNITHKYGYYYLNCFQDFFITGVTLFELMVVNNWYVIMEAYAVTFSQWVRLYFMIYYIVTMVIMTVIVSFILEAFLFRMHYRQTMQGHDFDDDAVLKVDVGLTPHEWLMLESQASQVTSEYLGQHQADESTIWFRGERKRSKNDFSEKMYWEQVQQWIEEDDRLHSEDTNQVDPSAGVDCSDSLPLSLTTASSPDGSRSYSDTTVSAWDVTGSSADTARSPKDPPGSVHSTTRSPVETNESAAGPTASTQGV